MQRGASRRPMIAVDQPTWTHFVELVTCFGIYLGIVCCYALRWSKMGAETKSDVPHRAADGFCLLGQDAGRVQASREQHAASPERRKFREAVLERHARSRRGAMGWTAGDGSGERVCGETSCFYLQSAVKSAAGSRMDQAGLTTIALAPGQRPAMLAVGLFWTNSTSRRDRAHRLNSPRVSPARHQSRPGRGGVILVWIP